MIPRHIMNNRRSTRKKGVMQVRRGQSSLSEPSGSDISYRDSRCVPFNPMSMSVGRLDSINSGIGIESSVQTTNLSNLKNTQLTPMDEFTTSQMIASESLDGSSFSDSKKGFESDGRVKVQGLRGKFSAMFRGNRNGKSSGDSLDSTGFARSDKGHKYGGKISFPTNSLHGMSVLRKKSNQSDKDRDDRSLQSGTSFFRKTSKKTKQKRKNANKKKWYNPFTSKGTAYGSGSLQSENEEAFLMDSISWFGRHVPDCILTSFLNPTNRESMSVLDTDISESQLRNHSVESSMRKSTGILEELKEYKLPYATKHYSALLFVDISGFTKLSTLLDVESLSKVINSYFHIIVDTITNCEGDILKFAGDAVFAEWRGDTNSLDIEKSMQIAAIAACSCGAKIVETCSDYPVFKNVGPTGEGEQVSTLNVHCGVGFGLITGVHVGDNEKRREYLIMGEPINQVRFYLNFRQC